MLNKITTGTPTKSPPLLIAHGLFGSAHNWGVIAKRLSDGRQVVAVDMRNHGESTWYSTHSYKDLSADLAEVANSLERPVDVLGHSMGGKAAMLLALENPDLVNRLVIADIAPKAYSHTQKHLIDAMLQVDLAKVERRSDADHMLAPLVDEPTIRSFLLQSIDVNNKRWRLNLPVLAAEMNKIVGFPDVVGVFDGPCLFLTGADSPYVAQVDRPKIKSLFSAAKFAKIPGVGHWLHAEKPREFEATVRYFLDLAS